MPETTPECLFSQAIIDHIDEYLSTHDLNTITDTDTHEVHKKLLAMTLTPYDQAFLSETTNLQTIRASLKLELQKNQQRKQTASQGKTVDPKNIEANNRALQNISLTNVYVPLISTLLKLCSALTMTKARQNMISLLSTQPTLWMKQSITNIK